ncbi:MAG: hypothetical protein ACOX6N_04205 [Patescibacteria group bacterium]|jgi:hypothetical protein
MKIIPKAYAAICNKAIDPDCVNADQVFNPQTYVNNLIQTLINLLFIGAVLLFVTFFFLGAFRLITSQGDAKRVESGRDSLTYAFVGLLLVFSIFAILKLVGAIFGIQGLSDLSIPWPTL